MRGVNVVGAPYPAANKHWNELPSANSSASRASMRSCCASLRSPAVYIAAIGGPCGGGGLEMSVCFDACLGGLITNRGLHPSRAAHRP